MDSTFSPAQYYLLASSVLSFLASLFFQASRKENLSITFLVITALLVFSFAALLDPFLNLWDERFHALVAKNLVKHPLMPTLYDDPVVNMAYDRWDRYHVWIHKQPLFLWQMALSFKLFGVSEFSLRLPDVVLGAFLVFVGYRSGKLLVNSRVGYITGILIITTVYLLELVSGRQELDHNDFSFMVYVSLSLWSFIEYQHSKKRYWIYLIGLFSGMAILCKWVVGLLVYLGWFILKIQHKKYRPSQYLDLLTAFAVTVLIALPWQILTLAWYPSEAVHTFAQNAEHFTTPLDGHSGAFWYHFDRFDIIYGSLASFLILPALYLLYKDGKDRPVVISLVSMVLAVYLFFSLAATKMPSFTIVACMVILLAFAALIDHVQRYLDRYTMKPVLHKIIFITAIILIAYLRFDIGTIKEKHTLSNPDNNYSRMLMNNREIFKSLELPGNAVLFNVKGRHYIEAMFYTGLPAYNFIPTREQSEDLKSKGRIIAVFVTEKDPLPDYLVGDPTIILINKVIEGYN